MKIFICIAFLIFAEFTFANETQLGVILGSTTGISAKYDLGGDRAIDGALAYSIESRYGISLHADYLFNKARQFSLGEANPLNLYYGIGFRLINIRSGLDDGRSIVGVRAPIGIYYRTSNPNLELFGELAPVLDVAPRTDVYIDVGLGVRFIF